MGPATALAVAAHAVVLPGCSGHAEAYARTDLYFGLSRQADAITEAEFQSFVDGYVTPRFPQGLTLLSGIGQFRDAQGVTLSEGTKLLILLYPRDAQADEKIDAIRTEYRQRFRQQSVLRADSVWCVSF